MFKINSLGERQSNKTLYALSLKALLILFFRCTPINTPTRSTLPLLLPADSQKLLILTNLPISNLVLTNITVKAMPIEPPKNNIALQNAKKNELINCGIYLIVHGLFCPNSGNLSPLLFATLFSTSRHFVNFLPGTRAISCCFRMADYRTVPFAALNLAAYAAFIVPKTPVDATRAYCSELAGYNDALRHTGYGFRRSPNPFHTLPLISQ